MADTRRFKLPLPASAYNIEKLDEELRPVVGFAGLSTQPMKGAPTDLYAVLDVNAGAGVDAQVMSIVQRHDPLVKSAAEMTRDARAGDLGELLGNKVTQALTQIETDLGALGGTPTNAQVIAILTRTLQRQRAIIKGLRWLVE